MNNNYKWEIIEEFKGKSHKEGGIDISISKGNIEISVHNQNIKAQFGMLIDSDSSKGTPPPEENQVEVNLKPIDIIGKAPSFLKYVQDYEESHPFDIEQYIQERFSNPMGREYVQRMNSDYWRGKLREEGLKKREIEIEAVTKQALLIQYFNPANVNESVVAERQFRERYGTSPHRYRYEIDPTYRAYYDEEAKKARSKIDYISTDLNNKKAVSPNDMWMHPNLSGETQRGMVDFNKEIIGSALPIPGVDEISKIPSAARYIGKVYDKALDAKRVIYDKISDAKVDKLISKIKTLERNIGKSDLDDINTYNNIDKSFSELSELINSPNLLSKKTYEKISNEFPGLANIKYKMVLNSNHRSVINEIVNNPDAVPSHRYIDVLSKLDKLPKIKIEKLKPAVEIPDKIKEEILSNSMYAGNNDLKDIALSNFRIEDILTSKNIELNSLDALKLMRRDEITESEARKMLRLIPNVPVKTIYKSNGELKFSDKFIIDNFLSKEEQFLEINSYPKHLTRDLDLSELKYTPIQREVFEKYDIAPIKIFPREFTRQLKRNSESIKSTKDLLNTYNTDLYSFVLKRFKEDSKAHKKNAGMGLGIGENGNWIGLGHFATPKRVKGKGYGELNTVSRFKRTPIILDADDAYKLPLKGRRTGTSRGLQYESVDDALYDSNYLRSLGVDAIRIYPGEIQLYSPDNIDVIEVGIFSKNKAKYRKIYDATVKSGIVPIAIFPIFNALKTQNESNE